MKILVLSLALVLAFGWVKAQELPTFEFDDDNVAWPGLGSVPDFAMDGQGNLYIVVRDENDFYHAVVRKYEDGQWSTVAEDSLYHLVYWRLFEVAPDGTLYMADSSGKKINRWNGKGWEDVGTPGPDVRVDAMAVAPDGTLYMTYRDSLHEGKLTVQALKEDGWQTVGNAGFLNAMVGQGDIVIYPDGTPYVVYTTRYNGYNTVVARLNGNTWERVGPDIIKGAGSPRLTFSFDGIPFLAFSDSLYGYRATVMRLEVNQWQPIGPRGFSAAGAIPAIASDRNSIPYVAYSDSSLGRRIIVKKSDGAKWETVGNAGFSDYNAVRPSLLISPSGTPYVAYADEFNRVDEWGYWVRVARLVENTWQSVGSGDLFKGIHAIGDVAAANDRSLYIAYHYDYWFDYSFEDWMKTKVVKWKDGILTHIGDIDYFKGIETIKLAVAPDQTLYMAYVDSASDFKTSVFKLEGDSWQLLGIPFDFSNSFDLDIDSTGTPFLTLDTNMMKYENGSWVAVSEEGFSDSPVMALAAVDKEGTLYVAYANEAINSRPTVKRLKGTAWEDTGIPATEGGPVFLATDERNNLYVALGIYNTFFNTFNYRFMKLEDGSWKTIEANIGNFNSYNMVMDPRGTFFVSTKKGNGETAVLTFNDSTQDTLVGNSLLKGHFPSLETDGSGRLYMVFDPDNVKVYNYIQKCISPAHGGVIAGSQSGCDAFDPEMITGSSAPTGYEGTLEYQWQRSTTGATEGFTDTGQQGETYDPGMLNQTTWFRRLAKVTCLPDWTDAAVSNVVKMTVEPFPGLFCPADDTVFNDTGSLTARRSYSALPEGTPDTLAVYSIGGKAVTFPYDFPIGTTTVEVKAHGSCAVDAACSFRVTVRQVTAIAALDAGKLSLSVYPNPFTREVTIEVANASHKEVTAAICSITGQMIKTLAKAQKGAKISLRWDGTNEAGQKVPPGVYVCRINNQSLSIVYSDH